MEAQVQTLDLSTPAMSGQISLPLDPPKKRGRPRGSGLSIRSQVQEYKRQHPNATAKQIIEKLGVNGSSVRKALDAMRKVKVRQKAVKPQTDAHPLTAVFEAAIQQVTKGKGVRHGGETTPFLAQPWAHYAQMHGRGFLTGQAAKKLEEAVTTKEGEAYIQELLGAMVYIGMAVLHKQGERK
jgi:hypothetical protein